ncbi:MAG: hypothetical protein IKT96_04525 [Paludibacteraceae bacterium]|nr:hypothetical protein [Paludibacteraceae bacterium]
MSLKNHIIRVFGFLNEGAEYAVLRNYEGLPDRNESRDIDIIITRRSFCSIKRELVEVLCQEGWRVVTYLNSDRLIKIVCAKNVGHETEIVQWDFFVNTSVWGVELMSAEEFVEHRVWNGVLWHVDVVGEFLDKYLYNRAVGAKYPAKYERIRTQIVEASHGTHGTHGNSSSSNLDILSPTDDTDLKDFSPSGFNDSLFLASLKKRSTDDTDFNAGEASASSVSSVGSVSDKEISVRVARKLEEVFGCGDLEMCDGLSGKWLLWRAVKWNVKRRPLGLIVGVWAFVWSFVRNYLCTNTGFAIGFTGPDGVGKTTVIEMLIERLGGVFRTAHSYMHFRPMLFGNLGEVAHSAGLKREVDRNYNDPHRGKKVGVVNSLVRLAYYSVDYIVGYWLKVKSQIRITRLVVFDRYYTDVICDSRRSRIFLNYKFLYWFGRVFVPQLDYNVLLTASVETVLARKQELTREGIERINEKIEYLAGKRGYVKFVNDGAPEEVVTEILEWVFEGQHQKNLRRL